MSKNFNKKHWYDGKFYAAYIDPLEKEIREIISSLIEKNSTVIDVGCGTGALVFQLAEKCLNVDGIDSSSKMIQFANAQKEKGNFVNVRFFHAHAAEFTKMIDQRFDYAVAAFVFHEMSADNRIKTVNEMHDIAKKIIIADYVAKAPKNLWGLLNTVGELLGGIGNFKHFRSFISEGGIDGLLKRCELKVKEEKLNKTGTYKVVRAIK